MRAAPLLGRTIVLDPGHNGGSAGALSVINQLVPSGRGKTKPCNTTGAATGSGYTEAAFNWDVAIRLRRLLVANGARVVMTRNDNSGVGPCVNQRAATGNAAHADAVVAIHADGGPANGHGFDVLYPPNDGETVPIYQASLRLAQAIHQAILATTVFPTSTYVGRDGYDVRTDLGGLNLSRQPAIFVELGNMQNSGDARLQTDPAVRERLARGLASGLDRFLSGG